MDVTSLQSIEQKLLDIPFEPQISRSQYMKNLKSQCLYRQNAIKTAEILIEEYYHQNQELKLELSRLNQKLSNYQQLIQILKQQLQTQNLSQNQNYQKELFQSSAKLSQVLEKYSHLQEKYHLLEKQLITLKNQQYQIKNQQNLFKNEQQMIKDHKHKENSLQRKNQIKTQIEKQFNNFLKTPTHKNSSRQINNNASTQKKSFSKNKYEKNDHQQSSSEEQIKKFQTINFKINNKDKFAQSIYGFQVNQNQKFPFHPGQFKKIVQEKIKIIPYEDKKLIYNNICENKKANEDKLMKKLKVLEWKIKQKDEQILLMLRRNKQIESKYFLLKQIFEKQQQSPFQNLSQEDKLKTIEVKIHKNNEKSQQKKRTSENTKNSHRKEQHSNDQKYIQDSIVQSKKKQKRVNSSYRKNDDNNLKWKNYGQFKIQ